MSQQEEIEQYLEKMKDVQKEILEFIENRSNSEEDLSNLTKVLDENAIKQNKQDLKSTLHLIAQIANEHHRCPNFYSKIEQIISIFKNEIKNDFTNHQISHAFRNNERILLFLIEEKLVKADKNLAASSQSGKHDLANYPQFLYPELKSYLDEKFEPENIDYQSKEFDQKRRIGENDDPICQIIRKDSVEDFSAAIEKDNIELTSTIKPSIFETNFFLKDKKPTLIEYAAFCGSFEIFKYLVSKEVELKPSLWIYAIHGQKLDLIRILEDKKIIPEDETYKKCLYESIKCHHPEIANYIQNNLIADPAKIDNHVLSHSFKFYNYAYFPNKLTNDFGIFYQLCQYDYYCLVEMILKDTHMDINQRRILN